MRFRDSVTDLFRNNAMPDSESVFQGYLYTLILSSEIFSIRKMEASGILRKDLKGDVYLSPKGRNSKKKIKEKRYWPN